MDVPSGEQIVIRAGEISDAPAMRELRLAALQRDPEAFGSDYARELAWPESHWVDRLSQARGRIYFAEEEKSFVGMAGIYHHEQVKMQHNAVIWGVYVRPEWRKRGVGERLIRRCLQWAKEGDRKLVKLAVIATNISAIACYERCGFRTYGVDPQVILHDGIYYDELLMVVSV